MRLRCTGCGTSGNHGPGSCVLLCASCSRHTWHADADNGWDAAPAGHALDQATAEALQHAPPPPAEPTRVHGGG